MRRLEINYKEKTQSTETSNNEIINLEDMSNEEIVSESSLFVVNFIMKNFNLKLDTLKELVNSLKDDDSLNKKNENGESEGEQDSIGFK